VVLRSSIYESNPRVPRRRLHTSALVNAYRHEYVAILERATESYLRIDDQKKTTVTPPQRRGSAKWRVQHRTDLAGSTAVME
jgi:hypothetical protein